MHFISNDNLTVIITAYNKPELLYINLEQLSKNKPLNKLNILILTEYGYDKDQDRVIEYFNNTNPLINISRHIKPKYAGEVQIGMSTMLYQYKLLSTLDTDYFILLEEDIIPTEDYILFNKMCLEIMYRYDRIFCTAHKRRVENELIGDPEILIGDYQLTSPSCISKTTIDKFITPILDQYYDKIVTDPVATYKDLFPNSRIAPNNHTHHDGFLERVMEKNNLFVLKPDQSRSMHIGLSGACCRGTPPVGTLEQKISEYRELMKDSKRLKARSMMPDDMTITDPKGPIWGKLNLDTDRTKAKASSWWYDLNNDFKDYIRKALCI